MIFMLCTWLTVWLYILSCVTKYMIIGQTDPPKMKEESQNTITDHMIWILFLYLYAFKHVMYWK